MYVYDVYCAKLRQENKSNLLCPIVKSEKAWQKKRRLKNYSNIYEKKKPFEK